VDTHLLIVARGLSDQIRMENASGITRTGDPYRRVFLPGGVLMPGQSIVQTLLFRRQSRNPDDDEEEREVSHLPPVSYTLVLLSGQGNP
jgi:hypothetical protein